VGASELRGRVDRLAQLRAPRERRAVFDRFGPESGQALFELFFGMLDGGGATVVDTSRIACPVLAVAGGEDRVVSPASVRATAAGLRAATIWDVAGQGTCCSSSPGPRRSPHGSPRGATRRRDGPRAFRNGARYGRAMPSSEVRVALVGCGAIAEWHWNAIRAAAPRVRVTACVDPSADRAAALAEKTGGAPFPSLAAAVAAKAADAAAILVPHHLHEPLALEAFAAGLHVFLEKPMATTLDACARILAAARDAGPCSCSRRTRSTGRASSARRRCSTRARSARS
jgi:hypothetical protein